MEIESGATEAAILAAESQLHIHFPPLFRHFLLRSNGGIVRLQPSGTAMRIYHVYDPRDPESEHGHIGAMYFNPWTNALMSCSANVRSDYSHLVPFTDFPNGDFLCLDYRCSSVAGMDPPVVRWCYESKLVEPEASGFSEFLSSVYVVESSSQSRSA